MIDLTLEKNLGKTIERVVEGYSSDEKLVVRITCDGVELRSHRSLTAPVVSVTWARIHRTAIAAELEATRKLSEKINEMLGSRENE